jgi:hypothetical protein
MKIICNVVIVLKSMENAIHASMVERKANYCAAGIRTQHRDLRHHHLGSIRVRPTQHAASVYSRERTDQTLLFPLLQMPARKREPECRCTEQMRATDGAGARAPRAPSRVRPHSLGTGTRSKLAGAPPPIPQTAELRPCAHLECKILVFVLFLMLIDG